jgi:biopolymer transport protein ExbD
MQVQDDKPYDDINITPMLDLAYVLLVIFILMCTASVQGLKANLPSGGKPPNDNKPRPKVQSIQVTGDNRFQLNGKDVSIEQLQAQLAQAKSQNPQMQVVLKGESATHYASVVQVLHVISLLEVKQVGLATKPTKAK